MPEPTAAAEAASWLRLAARGYERKYGSVPLETRIDLARAWIDLARVESADRTNESTDDAR